MAKKNSFRKPKRIFTSGKYHAFLVFQSYTHPRHEYEYKRADNQERLEEQRSNDYPDNDGDGSVYDKDGNFDFDEMERWLEDNKGNDK